MVGTGTGQGDSGAALPAGADRGVVVTLQPDPENERNHETVTRNELGRRLAALLGYRFAGAYVAARSYPSHVYFLPAATMVGIEAAARLGIHGETDLFGAVVPHEFMGTKTITHPLVEGHAYAPDGWCHGFCDAVRHAVLAGYAAFAVPDVRRAAERMLSRGPARLKRASGIGGNGQRVVHSTEEIDAALAWLDVDEVGTLGIVIEENLSEVTTFSVGQVRVGGLAGSYCGTQHLTSNNRGAEVYGGSSLLVARGDFDALLAQPLGPESREAIRLARAYDAAARTHLPGMFASRRNYDVVTGRNPHGEPCAGVLEQSWRMGGASGAEIAALQAFQDEPERTVVRASSSEVYGECEVPADAIVYFRGDDERVGRLTKYTVVEAHADA